MAGRTLGELEAAVCRVAPLGLAADWDNTGLLLGDPAWPLSGPVLATIDLSPAVVREVIEAKAGAVIAYHPPIFTPIKRITTDNRAGMTILELAARRIGIVAPHTALDAAPGGLADWLLEQCAPAAADIGTRQALEPHATGAPSFKVVTFVPLAHVDAVAAAMAGAGAGVIGDYTHCSYRVDGTGTFLGGAQSTPAMGKRGELEHVGEMRLEMVSTAGALAGVVRALRETHPYEEPAFDVYKLTAPPDERIGAGRIGTLSEPESAGRIVARLGARLGVPAVRLAGDERALVQRVAVCPGSGGSLAEAAAAAGADLFVTGEMTHHDVLASLERQCLVALAGHTETERPYLPVLAKRIAADLGIEVQVSQHDRAPLAPVAAKG